MSDEFKRQLTVGNVVVSFLWRSTKHPFGRFGGGWNWKVGFTADRRTLYIHLLIAELCFKIKSSS